MRIYISSSFTRQHLLRPYRDALWKMSHEVVSTWLDEIGHPDGMDFTALNRRIGIKDLGEVRAADMLIMDNEGVASPGRNVEFGVALGSVTPKIIYLIGIPSSAFHHLADKVFADWVECLAFIREMPKMVKP
jgi:hypothetical protein